MNKNLKPIARALLQARVDGDLVNQEQVAAMIKRFQPPGGFLAADMKMIIQFGTELADADKMPGAKVVAGKYGLDIVY